MKIESSYGLVLLLQSSMMSFFLCILLYKVVHSSILEKPTDFIYFFGFTIVMILKVSVPQYFGQRIISKSEETINALYETDWYEQTIIRRKFLVTLLICNQKAFKINVWGFHDLNLEYLGLVCL